MKTLRRQVLISERDYLRMRGQARRLYDRVEFTPVSAKEIEHEYLLNILSSTNPQSVSSPLDLKYPALHRYLCTIKTKLYNVQYSSWLVWRGGDDRVWLRSRGNARASCLGWAQFEKDFELAGEST